MIVIGNEQLIPIRQVPAKLPPRANGEQVQVTTVYRWINQGVRSVKSGALCLAAQLTRRLRRCNASPKGLTIRRH